MGFTLVTDVIAEPIGIDEAKHHLRVDGTDDDAYIAGLILVARQRAETFINRKIGQQTWDYTLDKFRSEMDLPVNPVASVTYVKYYDSDEVLQTFDSSKYQLDTTEAVARLKPIVTESWPGTYSRYGAVTIRIVGGYAVIPEPIRHAILMTVGTLYNDREDSVRGVSLAGVSLPAQALLWPYRLLVL